MTGNVQELRSKTASESEKITINIGYVDLGHIDLLVRDGFYANRTDLIRTAIRNQVARHAEATRQSVSRRSLDLGLRHYSREELETARAIAASRSLVAPRTTAGAKPGQTVNGSNASLPGMNSAISIC